MSIDVFFASSYFITSGPLHLDLDLGFSPFYWAGFVAQRERAQQDFKMPHLTHSPFTCLRQAQHRDHPTLIRIVRGFFNIPQNYQHSRNCETGPPAYHPYPRRLESLTICRWNYKGSTFLLSYLKTLSVGPVGVSNSRPPASQPGAQPSEQPVRVLIKVVNDLPSYSRFWFMQIRWFVMSFCGHKVV